MILVDIETGIIQACAYQVSSSKSMRPLQTSIPYSLPPIGGGLTLPDAASTLMLFEEKVRSFPANFTVEDAFVKSFRGMSPNIACYLLSLCGIDRAATLNCVANDSLDALYTVFDVWRRSINHSAIKDDPLYDDLPVTVNPLKLELGPISSFTPIQILTEDAVKTLDSPLKPYGRNPLLHFLQNYYGNFYRRQEFAKLKSSCIRKISSRMNRAEKISKDFAARLNDAR